MEFVNTKAGIQAATSVAPGNADKVLHLFLYVDGFWARVSWGHGNSPIGIYCTLGNIPDHIRHKQHNLKVISIAPTDADLNALLNVIVNCTHKKMITIKKHQLCNNNIASNWISCRS